MRSAVITEERKTSGEGKKSAKKFQLSAWFVHLQANGRFFIEKTVGSGSRNQVHNETVQRTVAGVFCLTDVFEFIMNRFHYRTFTQQDPACQIHQPVFHIAFDTGNRINAAIQKHLRKRGRYILLVAEYFPEKFLHQHIKCTLIWVVHVSSGQTKAEQFTLINANQVQLKAVKPVHGAFAGFGHIPENPVTFDASVPADGDFSTVHEAVHLPKQTVLRKNIAEMNTRRSFSTEQLYDNCL
jgi:hypothetical protein